MATTSELITKNPFATFAEFPAGVTFENQEKGEQIILLLRAHMVTLIPKAIFAVFLLFVPGLLGLVLQYLNIGAILGLGASQYFWFGVFWYLLVFGYVFYSFVFWYFNVYLLTNERIIDFDFYGVLSKKISYAGLAQLEDVTPKTVGFAGTFFNYGGVFIQTAAERPEFEFTNVARPDIVAEKIFDQARLEEKETPGEVK